MRFATFKEVAEAHRAGDLRGELCLKEITSTGRVVLVSVVRGPDEDDYDEHELYRAESLTEFMVQVAGSFGWEGRIS